MFSQEEAKNMPPHCEFDHEIHIENDQMPPHSHIYLLSGTELGVCTLFVHMSAGSSVRVIFTEVSLLSQLLQKPGLVLSVFPFFQKEGTQMGKPCTWMQMKQLSPSPDDAGGEDIR